MTVVTANGAQGPTARPAEEILLGFARALRAAGVAVTAEYGGRGIGSGTRYGDTWEWNGQRWTERNLQTPGARDHHAMAYDGRIKDPTMIVDLGAENTDLIIADRDGPGAAPDLKS